MASVATQPDVIATRFKQLDTNGDGKALGLELPQTVTLKVIETEPGIKGATAAAQDKPATLETGLKIKVPSFISEGEFITVQTEDGKYLRRGGKE